MRVKLSISNIAWEASYDQQVYRLVSENGFSGIEIAPTRWFAQNPYEHIEEAQTLARKLRAEYGLSVSSLQSIWYGQKGKLFGTEQEREELAAYARLAVNFAVAVGAGNLVFGCPQNRVLPDGESDERAIVFFRACGDYAAAQGTCFSLEANPPIYQTNYINTTQDAFDVAARVASNGCRVNVDMGTMIYYEEPVSLIEKNLMLVNHVHVSEPGLVAPSHERLLEQMIRMLNANGYDGYISIEMGKACGMDALKNAVKMLATYVCR